MIIISLSLLFLQVSRQDPGFEETYHFQYYLLQKRLDHYKLIAEEGGWIKVPEVTDTIKPGVSNAIIGLVRTRLHKEKYLRERLSKRPNFFDLNLMRAVKRYQSNNGLDITGTIYNSMVKSLNVSVTERIRQLQLNKERWKTFPVKDDSQFLIVNIPDFKLNVIQNKQTILQMKVIVGRRSRPTPVFSANLTHIIFNPSWYVPAGILRRDVLPAALTNHNYFYKNQMTVYKIENGTRKAVSVDSINWQAAAQGSFPFSVVQAPGPKNPLGVVKFIFKNKFSVYMHDTPSKGLFEKKERTFSSGCIRLAKPMELAYLLLKTNPDWTNQRIDNAVNNKKTVTAYLQEPVPVHICYFTAWVNEKGQLQFRPDIYNRDKKSN